jgi:uncharacterized repeat protein (TIGR03803 family)
MGMSSQRQSADFRRNNGIISEAAFKKSAPRSNGRGMKKILQKQLFSAFAVGLAMLLADEVRAQKFVTVFSFSDGDNPYVDLVTSGDTFFGATWQGGLFSVGSVFKVTTTGTDFAMLHSFAEPSTAFFLNADGCFPRQLILSSNTLFGCTAQGAASGHGSIFKLNTNGTGFEMLRSCTGGDGEPQGLLLLGNALYGTTSNGGDFGLGTVFKMDVDGTRFTTLHRFGSSDVDGMGPLAGLLELGGILYGTTTTGGSFSFGTVFRIATNGSNYRILHSFPALSGPSSTNTEGAYPRGLIVSGNTLFGIAAAGGSSGKGTLFRIDTTGGNFKTLHSFSATSGSVSTNSDGSVPSAKVTLKGATLYGTAPGGGAYGNGAVFQISTNGDSFKSLYSFTAMPDASTNEDGAKPVAALTLLDASLFGVTARGGAFGKGTIFSISLPPELTIIRNGQTVELTWPNPSPGFILQSTTTLNSDAQWQNESGFISEINGQNALSVNIAGAAIFYRLFAP